MAEIAAEVGLSAERVRQVVRRADGGARPARRPGGSGGGERVRLRIGNLAKAVLVTGQAYQDPKDALNEFVSNAADDYAEAGLTGRRIRILLRRQGTRAAIAVDDSGRGMDPDRLRAVARNLFESSKAGDDRTLGEKAIGLLAFQQLGGCCEIVSRANGSDETWTLRLRRGDASADLVREKRRARATSGTTVFISDLDTEAARVLTQRKVVEYLRRRRGAAIAARRLRDRGRRGSYRRARHARRTGRAADPARRHDTLWGKLEFALYVAGDTDATRRVAVVGRAGTTIIDDIADLEEFDHEPWTSGHLSGRVSFEPLRQSAGRRAILRDDDIYPVFRDAVRSVEPALDAGHRAGPPRPRRRHRRAPRRRPPAGLRPSPAWSSPTSRTRCARSSATTPTATASRRRRPVPDPANGHGHPAVDRGPRPARPRPTHHRRRPPARAVASDRQRHLPSIAPDPSPVTVAAGSTPTRAPCSTTSSTPTSSSSRTTRPRCSTTSPRSSPRSTSSTTTHAPTPTSSPKSSSAC